MVALKNAKIEKEYRDVLDFNVIVLADDGRYKVVASDPRIARAAAEMLIEGRINEYQKIGFYDPQSMYISEVRFPKRNRRKFARVEIWWFAV